ncbi:MAG: hypothetical protein ACOX6L_09385 [Syntrophomonadaceae bacterium]|jgi:hypothetical protein
MANSGRTELWRRLAIFIGILAGVGLFFYIVPALINITAVNWQQEQADELKSISGYVTSEDKRLNQLPLNEYIAEKTGGKETAVDSDKWADFFREVEKASYQEYSQSIYGNRVSELDKDEFWKPRGLVPVFFKPAEIPYAEWSLIPEDGARAYVFLTSEATTSYFLLRYEDYLVSVGAMSQPYRQPPGWLYRPYRNIGIGLMILGLLLYIVLPRRKKTDGEISYAGGRIIAGDIVAMMLLTLFYGLPFLINGGTVQAVTGMWPVTLIMWLLALLAVVLLYYSAWYASYRIELTPEAIHLITFKGEKACRFDEITAVELISLRNPGWFRKLFLAMAMLSMLSGRGSTQPAGSALLAATASYGGLEIRTRNGKPVYLWFTDQLGGVILPNFDRVPQALQSAGISIKEESREIEGFSMFM